MLDVIVVLAALVIVLRRKRAPTPAVDVPEPAEPRGRGGDRAAPRPVVDPGAPKTSAPARAAVVLHPPVTRPWGESGLPGWRPANAAGVGDTQPVAAAVALPPHGIGPRGVGAADRLNPDARQIFVLAVNEASLQLWLPAAAVVRAGDPLRVQGSSPPLVLNGWPEDQHGGAVLRRLDRGNPVTSHPAVAAPQVGPHPIRPRTGAGPCAGTASVVLVGELTNGAAELGRDVRRGRERRREPVGGRV